MGIRKIKIKNFKCFKDEFELELNSDVNVIVGYNEAGKSTILEAIHLGLTGIYCGKSIYNELSQYLINNETVLEYIAAINAGRPILPPKMSIEIFFDDSTDAMFKGYENSDKDYEDIGLSFSIEYNEKFNDEYNALIAKRDMKSLPIEYYDVIWQTFARQAITARSIPVKSAMIDSANYRYKNGSDVYISRIVKDLLTPEEIASITQAHRNMKEIFIDNEAIKNINARIGNVSSLVDGQVSLSVDLGTKNAWESSLTTQLNDIPFSYVGKGTQCILKTDLALTHKTAQKAQVILLEEPESHLTYSNLNQLMKTICEKYEDKQIIITTHSSFVANKIGLNNLILLKNHNITRMNDLSSEDFFRKMPGYDTLRILLCKKAILVEGDSDELVVQKAYMVKHNKLPIQDAIDVISVGTSFLRFLEIADKLLLHVTVVTDNDGSVEALEKKYANYINGNKKDNIKICYAKDVDTSNLVIKEKKYNCNTLEPKLLKANDYNLAIFNELFNTTYDKIEEMQKYMQENKTNCALKIFENCREVNFPDYILEAIEDDK